MWKSLVLTGFIFLVGLSAIGAHNDAEKVAPGAVVLEAKGYLVSARQVTVSPRVRGQVVELLIEEGQRVQSGAVLARLDPAEYDLALRIARANLSLAEAEQEKVKQGDAKADLAIARAKVEVARARVELAQYNLEGTVVRAPFNGTVLTKRAEVGALLDPKSFGRNRPSASFH